MQHSITIEDFGVRLRPVRLDDAAFIVWLRNMDHAKGRIGDSAQDVASQEQWLRAYFERDGDYYFIIETGCGIPVGTYGIYNMEGDHAEGGRWIVRPEVPAALPGIILAYEAAFERLGLSQLKGYTVATNYRVLSLNRKLGHTRTGGTPVTQIIEGKPVQLVGFELHAADWFKTREAVRPLARLAEEKIRDWEQSATSRTPTF